MSDAKLVFGLWSLGDKPQLAEQWREAAGARYVVVKLEDAVALCKKLISEGDCHSSAKVAAPELALPHSDA